MLPTLSCPTCRKPISLPEQFAGAVVNCPHCANPLTVPQIHELAPAPVVLPVKSGNQGAAMGAFEDMPNQSARRTKYAPASPNYPKLIFFLLLGAIAFAVVGGIAAYFILIAIPDSEYHERRAEAKRLLDDYFNKYDAMPERSKPSAEQQAAVSQARTKYIIHLHELIDFCVRNRYMPDADGRRAARQIDLELANQLP